MLFWHTNIYCKEEVHICRQASLAIIGPSVMNLANDFLLSCDSPSGKSFLEKIKESPVRSVYVIFIFFSFCHFIYLSYTCLFVLMFVP